jgi:hypothetical protein
MSGNESLVRRKVIHPSLQHRAFCIGPVGMRVSGSAPIFTRICRIRTTMTFRVQSAPRTSHHHAIFHSGSESKEQCSVSWQIWKMLLCDRSEFTEYLIPSPSCPMCRTGSILISTIPLRAGHGIYAVAWKTFTSRRGKMKVEPGTRTQRKPRLQKPSRNRTCWSDDKSFDNLSVGVVRLTKSHYDAI